MPVERMMEKFGKGERRWLTVRLHGVRRLEQVLVLDAKVARRLVLHGGQLGRQVRVGQQRHVRRRLLLHTSENHK